MENLDNFSNIPPFKAPKGNVNPVSGKALPRTPPKKEQQKDSAADVASDIIAKKGSLEEAPPLQRRNARGTLSYKEHSEGINRRIAKRRLLPSSNQENSFGELVPNVVRQAAEVAKAGSTGAKLKRPHSMEYEELNREYLEPMGKRLKFGRYETFGIQPKEIGNEKRLVDLKERFAEFRRDGKDVPQGTWKVHISVNKEQLAKAWNVVYPFLVTEECQHFKVSRLKAQENQWEYLTNTLHEAHRQLKDESNQNKRLQLEQLIKDAEEGLRDLERVMAGMQITLYVPPGEEKRYNRVVEMIEEALAREGISPGKIDQLDKKIGEYSSVRHEGKHYKPYNKLTSYNPDGFKDEWQTINLKRIMNLKRMRPT